MPTVFIQGAYRYYFYSNEEERKHIHVSTPEGEAKIWLEPNIEIASLAHLSATELNCIIKTVIERKEELINAWNLYFRRNEN